MKKYIDYSNDELKHFCKEKGLKTSGNKNALVSRLLKFDTSKSNTSDIFNQTGNFGSEAKTIKASAQSIKETFFLQIKAANLSNYFNFGYIYPLSLEESEIYKNENRIKDILSIFEDYIILGKGPFNEFESSDILIELVLNGIKVTEYEQSGLFYVAEPIPISRVKTIYFKTTAIKTTFLSSIMTFPDSFIPNSICKTISVDKELSQIDFEKIILPKNENLSTWRAKLDLYDKTLGLLAFIKNASIIFAERENKFEDYSPGFFSTLNLINPIRQLASFRENIFLKPLIHYQNFEISNIQRAIFKSIVNLVYDNKIFDIPLAINILQDSIAHAEVKNGELLDVKDEIGLLKQLEELKISYKGLLQLEVFRKNPNLPSLALLFLSKFPNKSRQNTDKQAVRNVFIENEFDFSLNVAEYITGFLGLYYGYKNMIKEDTNLKFVDKNFEFLASKTQSIKFKLESYLDRFILESVFQFAIKHTTLSDPFEFLNWSNDTNETIVSSTLSSYQYHYLDKSFSILGQRVLSVQRVDKIENVFDKIVSQYVNGIEDNSYLVAFVKKYLHFDKRQIIDLLKKNKGNYPLDELERVIELDTQFHKSKR